MNRIQGPRRKHKPYARDGAALVLLDLIAYRLARIESHLAAMRGGQP